MGVVTDHYLQFLIQRHGRELLDRRAAAGSTIQTEKRQLGLVQACTRGQRI